QFFTFQNKHPVLELLKVGKLCDLSDPVKGFTNDDIIVEFYINITSSMGGTTVLKVPPYVILANVCVVSETDNVTLVLADKRVRVCEEFFQVRSGIYFEKFLFGYEEQRKRLSENKSKEVEFRDVKYEDFLDFIQFIYRMDNMRVPVVTSTF
ncbi:hypothetical protein PFISCL1PPCAC_26294, partial [Pristionchus fissidentatus]